MDTKEIFQTVVKIIKLDKETIKKVAEDKQTLLPAVLIIAISGFLSGLLSGVEGILRVFFIPLAPIIAVAVSFISSAIIYAIAYLLGGRGSYLGLYKPVAYSYILGWLSIIPFIGWIPSLWCFVVLVVTLMTVMNLTQVKAICTVIIVCGVWLACIGIGLAVDFWGTKFRQCITEKMPKRVEEITKQVPAITPEEVPTTEQVAEPKKEAEEEIATVDLVKLPDDFPKDVLLPKNAKVVFAAGDEESTTVTLLSPEVVDKVANFFETSLKRNGWEQKKSFAEIGKTKSVVIDAFKDEKKLQIQITGEKEKGATVVISHRKQ